jgi:hypothetical protein
MSDFDGTQFILLFLTIYPPIAITIYLTIRLTLKYSFYRNLSGRIDSIRAAIIKHWQEKYSDISSLLEHVDVEHLRVICTTAQKEDKRFRLFTILFYVLSAILTIEGILGQSFQQQFLIDNTSLTYWIASISLLSQMVSLAWVGFASYYQYDYYSTLDILHKEAEGNALGVRLILRLKFGKMLLDEVRPKISPAIA